MTNLVTAKVDDVRAAIPDAVIEEVDGKVVRIILNGIVISHDTYSKGLDFLKPKPPVMVQRWVVSGTFMDVFPFSRTFAEFKEAQELRERLRDKEGIERLTITDTTVEEDSPQAKVTANDEIPF